MRDTSISDTSISDTNAGYTGAADINKISPAQPATSSIPNPND